MSLKNNFDLNIIKSNKMEFTDDFIHSYKQGITKTVKVSDTEITAADIVSRLAQCIERKPPDYR